MSPSTQALFLFGASGQIPVFELGRWWTVLSAGWLHGGILHLLFNMSVVRSFAPATADLYGPGRMVILYTVSSITGFLFSSVTYEYLPWIPLGRLLGILGLGGAHLTLGASAPIFGLLGALLYYGKRTGSRVIREQMVGYAIFSCPGGTQVLEFTIEPPSTQATPRASTSLPAISCARR